jgi:hypothetical protein
MYWLYIHLDVALVVAADKVSAEIDRVLSANSAPS